MPTELRLDEPSPSGRIRIMAANKRPTAQVKPVLFCPKLGQGTTLLHYEPKVTIFSQGDSSDAVFYVQEGKLNLTVVSPRGREAIIGVSTKGDFLGEQCLLGEICRAMTATTAEDCSLVRIERGTMLRALREDLEWATAVISYLLSRNLRLHEDLVDHFFNHSEKRLARLLLSLAHYGKSGRTEKIPRINQETLAEMVGTTRGRISFFMTKFKNQGFIDYSGNDGSLRVHSSLLNMVLHD